MRSGIQLIVMFIIISTATTFGQTKKVDMSPLVTIRQISEYGSEGFSLVKIKANKRIFLVKSRNSKEVGRKQISNKAFGEINDKIRSIEKYLNKKTVDKCRHIIEIKRLTKGKENVRCVKQKTKQYSIYSALIFDLNIKLAEN